MNLHRVGVLLGKEWSQVFRDRLVLWTFAFVPIVFVILGLSSLYATTSFVDAPALDTQSDEIRAVAGPLCDGLGGVACLEMYMGTILLVLFLLLPAILPAFFAAFSVVGEKTDRTLEPLLATPLTVLELVVAKVLAGVIPSVLATWASACTYWAGCAVLLFFEVTLRLLGPAWLLAVFGLGPLFATASVLVAVMISSRTRDPRTAQQLSGLVVMPMLLFLVGQSFGLFLLNGLLVLVVAVLLVAIDAALLWTAVWVFDRERILTRMG